MKKKKQTSKECHLNYKVFFNKELFVDIFEIILRGIVDTVIRIWIFSSVESSAWISIKIHGLKYMLTSNIEAAFEC